MSKHKQLRLMILLGLCTASVGGGYTQAALTADQQAVYDAVIAELQSTSGTIKVGQMTIDKGNGSFTFPEKLTDGNVMGVTALDGAKHDFRLGLMHLDGYRGNLSLDSKFARNEVGTRQATGFKGIAGSNIAWGSANMAGIMPQAIKEKITINGQETEVIKGYERTRQEANFDSPLWNKDRSGRQSAYATAIGFYNVAYGAGAVAFGQYNVASSGGAFAGGRETIAAEANAFAYGLKTLAHGKQAIALGEESKVYADNAIALGRGTLVTGAQSMAGGSATQATGMNAFAWGAGSVASGGGSFAMGTKSVADGIVSFAFGDNAKATGNQSVAIGIRANAGAMNSMALGENSKANAINSLALAGGSVQATAQQGIAIGHQATVNTVGGIAIGEESLSDRAAHTYGYNPLTGKSYDEATIIAGYTPDKATEFTAQHKALMDKQKELSQVTAAYYKAVDAKATMLQGKGNIPFTSENLNKLDTQITENAQKQSQLTNEIAQLQTKVNTVTGAYQSSAAAISVGNSLTGMTRQITGVAAGTNDTDAVNVAQLKAVQQQVDSKGTHFFSTKSTLTAANTNYLNDGAKANDSVVVGMASSSTGVNSLVMGNRNQLSGEKNNVNNSVVVGHNLEVDGTHNAVFGTDFENSYTRVTKVFGEQNTVIGVGNLVGYSATQEGNTWKYTKDTNPSNENIIVGKKNISSQGGGNIIIGSNSNAGNLGLSLGWGNTVEGLQVDGTGGQYGVALGGHLTVKGEHAVAAGYESKATNDYTLAFGSESEASGWSALAFGLESKATAALNVALGANSVANRKLNMIGYHPASHDSITDTASLAKALGKEKEYEEINKEIKAAQGDKDRARAAYEKMNRLVGAWTNTRGALAIGDEAKGYTRQITGVAAGTNDTDAVNVAQLKAVQQQADSKGTHFFSIKSDRKDTNSNYNNDGAKAFDSVVIGIQSSSNGGNSLVIGNKNKLFNSKGTDNGFNHSVVVGQTLEVDGVHNAVFGTNYNNADNKLTKVFGDQNTVIGVGNLVGYNAEKKGMGYTYTKRAIKGDQNIVVGMTNTALQHSNIVIGSSSTAGNLGLSLGWNNSVMGGQYGVALGGHLTVKGEHAVAAGYESKATNDYTLAFGSESEASGLSALAFGHNSKATTKRAVTLGANAQTTADSAVALGANSVANRKAGMIGYHPISHDSITDSISLAKALGKSKEYQEISKEIRASQGDPARHQAAYEKLYRLMGAWSSTDGALAIGNEDKGYTRQITGVAAGTNDTDAVNVAQLKALAEKSASGDIHFYVGGSHKDGHYTVGKTTWSAPLNDLHIDFGDGLKAEQIEKDGKKYTLVSLDYDININTDPKQPTPNPTPSPNPTPAPTPSPAPTPGAADKVVITPTEPSLTITGGNNITTSTEANNTVKISLSDTITVNSVTAGKTTLSDKGVTYDGKTYIDEEGLHGNDKKITGVADGDISKDSKDAVNGSQIYALQQNSSNNSTIITEHTEQITNLNQTVNHLGGQLADLRDESRQGDAMNAALAALKPLDFDPLQRSQIMAGVGTYHGKQAIALGMAHYQNEDTLIHGGVSYGGSSDLMANLGISWRFGDKKDRNARAERLPQYAGGPISSLYVMQDEMAALQATNREQAATIAQQAKALEEQAREIEELQAHMRQVLARLK